MGAVGSARQGSGLGGGEGEGVYERRGRHSTEAAAPGAPGRAASFVQKAAHVASHCSMFMCRHARLRDPGKCGGGEGVMRKEVVH